MYTSLLFYIFFQIAVGGLAWPCIFKKRTNLSILYVRSSTFGEDFALETFQPFTPRPICIDKDEAERKAIEDVFPDAQIVLCHYHVMVLFIDEARALIASEEVCTLMNILRELCSSTTVEQFEEKLQKVLQVSATFYDYLSRDFLNEWWIDTCTEVNRQHPNWHIYIYMIIVLCPTLQEQYMLVEVSFETLKYVLLGGLQNKRLMT